MLFGAIFYGISLIWERDLGILQKFLVSPAPRTALVLGRAVSSAFRSLFQMVMYAIALLLGVQLQFGPAALASVTSAVILGSIIFSTFSLIIACVVKSRERFMGIGQLLTMPSFFASNAIYPLSMMPAWLRSVSIANPLTYQVDALRTFMVNGGHSYFGMTTDFGVQLLIFALLLATAVKLYPRIVN